MNHQQRRAPLPADYQYPTHGVDCDCPPCRNKVVDFERMGLIGGGRIRVPKRQMLTKKMGYDIRTDHMVPLEELTADTPWGV